MHHIRLGKWKFVSAINLHTAAPLPLGLSQFNDTMAGTVPETVLKKRKRDEEWANKKTAAAAEAQKKAKSSRKDILKRAESYVNEYRNQVCTSTTRGSTYVFQQSVVCQLPRQALVGPASSHALSVSNQVVANSFQSQHIQPDQSLVLRTSAPNISRSAAATS